MTDSFEEFQIKQAAKEQKREELRTMSDAVRKIEVTGKLKRIFDNQQINDILQNTDLTSDWDNIAEKARIKAMQRESCIPFVYPELNDIIQLAAGSLALFAASTGSGKSTLTANIAKTLIKAKKKVLLIINEEESDDVGARISCLDLGVSIHKYKIKGGITDEEKEKIITNMVNISRNHITICGLDFKGKSSITTSPEGMKALLTSATGKFDAVLIDYYQNVNTSIVNPGLKAHEANEMFANDLDYFKNTIGCPIILMAQIRRGETDYKDRLEGRRLILNKCTDIFELKTDKEHSRSILIIHKDRWLGNQGEEIPMGYKGGAYIPYNQAFEEEVAGMRARNIEKQGEVKDKNFNVNKLIEQKLGKEHSEMLDRVREEMEKNNESQ